MMGSSKRSCGCSLPNPDGILVDPSTVTLGRTPLPMGIRIAFTKQEISYKGKRYRVRSGVMDGYAFAGAEPERCLEIELAFIEAIEQDHGHSLRLDVVLDFLIKQNDDPSSASN